MKTINGIYLDLKESDYKLNYNGLIYYFSSKLYMNKFKNNVKQFIVEETSKLKTKYKINIYFDTMLTLSFYKKIEKRGFRVVYKENEKTIELTQDVLIANQILMK